MQNRTSIVDDDSTIRTEILCRVTGSIFGDGSPESVAHTVARIMKANGDIGFEVHRRADGKLVATACTEVAARAAAVEAVRQSILDRDLSDTSTEDALVAALESLSNSAGSVLASLEDPADAKYLRAAIKAADAVLKRRAASFAVRA